MPLAHNRNRRRAAWWGMFGLLLVPLLGIDAPARAGKFNRQLSAGDTAPAWKALPGVDGGQLSSADLKNAPATVVVFTCNHCPIARAYESQLRDLHADYARRGVRVVAISCSLYSGDDLPAMKERAAAAGWTFPYLFDASQRIGRAFGASVTPEVFLLDSQRRVVYLGAFDDGQGKPERAQRPYLRAALDALLAGQTPEVVESKPFGCGIVYEVE